uniref:Uncharacterized protein n=1 Tax=Vitis vinifera TaxID=29760 RepID=A5B8J7_VITVI|nr:hypothetical protein VITISV_036413 [Vitis vinifera]
MERHPGDRPRVHGVGTHPEQLHPDSPSGHAALANITPGRFPQASTRRLRTSLKCTSLTTSFRQPATTHVPPLPCHGFQRTLLNLGLLW